MSTALHPLSQRAKDKWVSLGATCGLITGEQEVSSGLEGQFRSMGKGLSAGVLLQEVQPHLNEVGLFSPAVPGTLPPTPAGPPASCCPTPF